MWLIESLNSCKGTDESDTNGYTNDDEADTSNEEDTSTEAETNAVVIVATRSELILELGIEEMQLRLTLFSALILYL